MTATYMQRVHLRLRISTLYTRYLRLITCYLYTLNIYTGQQSSSYSSYSSYSLHLCVLPPQYASSAASVTAALQLSYLQPQQLPPPTAWFCGIYSGHCRGMPPLLQLHHLDQYTGQASRTPATIAVHIFTGKISWRTTIPQKTTKTNNTTWEIWRSKSIIVL
jgi:hypothetical protein